MPKSRDFLIAFVPGFSERIHPGIFHLKIRDIQGYPGIYFLLKYLSFFS